jgi:hypothetical protein
VPSSSASAVIAVELHSDRPEQLVAFYEQVLPVKFTATTYPCRRYLAEMGRFSFIIADARGGADTKSDPGKVTVMLMSSTPPALAKTGKRYYLHPKRPLASLFPERHAARLQDPDGHYVAFVPSMEEVLGRVPPIQSVRALIDSAAELLSVAMLRQRVRLRVKLAGWLDGLEYATNHVTVLRHDLRGFTHVVASSDGLFAVNDRGFARIVRGYFFGLTVKNGDIYCFQSCGPSHMNDNRGRIVRLTMHDGGIRRADVMASGLDDGCHQMDFVGDDLLVVDCYNGRLLTIKPGAAGFAAHYPFGHLSRDRANEEHMNSIMAHPDGTIWVLLHQSGKKPSEVVILDRGFREQRRFPIDGGQAHNIALTDDENEYLIADSRGGRIVSARGVVAEGDMMMPRGISLDETTCVVGDSYFSTRPFRRFVPGRVHFFDRRTWKRYASIALPAAPNDVRRIDGQDLSLSNHFAVRALMTTR